MPDMQISHDQASHQPLPTGALATFISINRNGSMSGAATELHLSQPAVSRRLQGLEQHVGTPLFDRIAGRLHITAAGTSLLPHAERSVAAEADAIAAAQDQANQAIGSVEIAIVGSLIQPILTQVLDDVLERYPNVELGISTGTSAEVCSLVRRGDASLGVSYAQDVGLLRSDSLTFRTILTESLVVVGSANHPAAHSSLSQAQVSEHRWLVFPEHASHPESSGTIARRTLEQHQVAPTNLRNIDSLTAQLALVRAGYGLALVPPSMADSDLNAASLVIVDAPSIQIQTPVTLCTRSGAHVPPSVQLIAQSLQRGLPAS